MKTDEDLVSQALQGDAQAFNVLVRRYYPKLTAFVTRRVGSQEEAEDLVQEIFLKVYLALNRFNPDLRFSTWLYRIAINATIDHLRKKKIREVSLSPSLSDTRRNPEEHLLGKERSQKFWKLYETLSEDFRIILELRHFAGLSYEAIGEILQIPLGTVKNRLFRARRALAKQWRYDGSPEA